MLEIKIVYHNKELKPLEFIDGKSDWIDLRSAEDIALKKGDFHLLSLGVSMQLPDGYEAHVAPRSSTFKNWGIIQTNSVGIVDNSYCGDDDIWKIPILATRDTFIHLNDRVCQFRIVKNMPPVTFCEIDKLLNKGRGGFGSSGTK